MSLEGGFLAIGSVRDCRPYREPVYFFVFYKEIVSHIYIFCNNWDANDTYLNHFIAIFKSTDNVSLSVLLLYIMYFYKNELEAAVSEYIEYYNNHRYQKRLNCMTPIEYRLYRSHTAA